jgi:SEC-C motif-containing protein
MSEQSGVENRDVPAAMEELCPCGSQKAYRECCEPVITAKRKAATAEELMRSRYSAYARGKVDYILKSSHPDLRKNLDENATRQWSENAQWEGIEIVETTGGGENDSDGDVEFIARFTEDGQKRTHHERSRFKKYRGRWYYCDGEMIKPQPFRRDDPKIGRNDSCPCGSGKKFKRCCMA